MTPLRDPGFVQAVYRGTGEKARDEDIGRDIRQITHGLKESAAAC